MRRPADSRCEPHIGTSIRWQHSPAAAAAALAVPPPEGELPAGAVLPELQAIVDAIDSPINGQDLVDLYEQFLRIRAPQEKVRPLVQQLAQKWRYADVQLTPQQLCAIYSAHNRLQCFPMEAYRALGMKLLKMDISQFEIEDVVEILSINLNYVDHIQSTQITKSLLWSRMARRFRNNRATSALVQVLLNRAQQIPDEEIDAHDALGLLNVIVSMGVKRLTLLDKVLRRVADLQDVIEGQMALKFLKLVAAVPHQDHTEQSLDTLKTLLAKAEAYVQRIRDAESQRQPREAQDANSTPKLEAEVDDTRQLERMEQRKAIRLAAHDVTTEAMSVAEGWSQPDIHRPAEDRRLVAQMANRVMKAAQLQGIALQTDPDRYVGPPFMVREVTACLLGLGHAAQIGEKVGDRELANITTTHQRLVEFAVERALAIPSELYGPRDINNVLKGLCMLMWREERLFNKLADQAVSTEAIWSPLQVAEIISYMERMKVYNPRFLHIFYLETYANHTIDFIVIASVGIALIMIWCKMWEIQYLDADEGEG